MQSRFNILAEAYDAMVDWDKRLAREGPFYRKVFEDAGVRRVLDAACGTGRHAATFASWGLEVVGADLSAGMIEHCRATYAGVKGLSFEVRSFSERSRETFDAVVCAGNSLPLVSNMAEVDGAIGAMAASLRPSGVLIVQALNLGGRDPGPVRWDKCKRVRLSSGEALIIKGTHVAGGHGYVNFLLTDLERQPPQLTVDCVRFLALQQQGLVEACQRHSCGLIRVFGTFGMDEFDPIASEDLVLVAAKQAT